MLIIGFVSAIITLVAGIISAEDISITFKNIIVILIVRFVLAKVLFVNIKTN